ncbi:unnamed protein product [Paramecium octaurelia]|uniref:ubiquitinyl hydrolase 1 n=1 Tax=Paramecium octaurelia TaxID=43137 RepID=A0A8S1T1E6_PAROT|nr:unnamed protein product [Paramecium octaurelia]
MQQQKLQSTCPHFQRILLQRSIPQVHKSLSKLLVLFKNKQVKCDVCQRKQDYLNICLKCEKPLCDIEKICSAEHLRLNSPEHCVIINIHSNLIACLMCKIEIYDFEQTLQTEEDQFIEEIINPQKIRMEYHKFFYKQEAQNIQFKNQQNVQHAGMLNICNNSHLNCVLQILLNYPVIQQILQKINSEYEINEYSLKSNRKQILRELSAMASIYSQHQYRIINPSKVIKNLAQIDSKIIGYSRKDAYDAFKTVINFLNEEFKFSNLKGYFKSNLIYTKQALGHDWNIIADPSLYMEYSFIQSIFSGELISNLQCLNCKKITKSVEQFSALSLELPEIKQQGFFKQLVNNQKQSISLQECLDYFYEPVIDSLTLCSCGARSGKRQYSFQQQSNLLCIHLQRFLNKNQKDTKHVSFPIKDHNFQEYFNLDSEQNYRLFGIIVHLHDQGGDHFETILKYQNSQFLSIKDEIIEIVSQKYVEECEALLLFYEKVDNQVDLFKTSLRKNLQNQHNMIANQELLLKDEELCYLPHFWFEQFLHLAKPPSIITSHLICPHNLLKPDYWDFRIEYENAKSAQYNSQLDTNTSFITIGEVQNSNSPAYIQESSAQKQLQLTSIIIPKAVCEFLIEKYGGGPIIEKNIKTCSSCIEYAQQMSRRRKLERQLIIKYESLQGYDRIFVVHEEWLKKWQTYLYNSKQILQRNNLFGYPPPGEITNYLLLDKDQQIIQQKKEGQHFHMITAPIWHILQEIYGGGPTISINPHQQQYEPFKLQTDDLFQIKEIKTLYQNCINQYKQEIQQ